MPHPKGFGRMRAGGGGGGWFAAAASVAVLIAALAVSVSAAQDPIWCGGTSSDWNDPTNWNTFGLGCAAGSTVPQSDALVSLPAVGAAVDDALTGALQLGGLTIRRSLATSRSLYVHNAANTATCIIGAPLLLRAGAVMMCDITIIESASGVLTVSGGSTFTIGKSMTLNIGVAQWRIAVVGAGNKFNAGGVITTNGAYLRVDDTAGGALEYNCAQPIGTALYVMPWSSFNPAQVTVTVKMNAANNVSGIIDFKSLSLAQATVIGGFGVTIRGSTFIADSLTVAFPNLIQTTAGGAIDTPRVLLIRQLSLVSSSNITIDAFDYVNADPLMSLSLTAQTQIVSNQMFDGGASNVRFLNISAPVWRHTQALTFSNAEVTFSGPFTPQQLILGDGAVAVFGRVIVGEAAAPRAWLVTSANVAAPGTVQVLGTITCYSGVLVTGATLRLNGAAVPVIGVTAFVLRGAVLTRSSGAGPFTLTPQLVLVSDHALGASFVIANPSAGGVNITYVGAQSKLIVQSGGVITVGTSTGWLELQPTSDVAFGYNTVAGSLSLVAASPIVVRTNQSVAADLTASLTISGPVTFSLASVVDPLAASKFASLTLLNGARILISSGLAFSSSSMPVASNGGANFIQTGSGAVKFASVLVNTGSLTLQMTETNLFPQTGVIGEVNGGVYIFDCPLCGPITAVEWCGDPTGSWNDQGRWKVLGQPTCSGLGILRAEYEYQFRTASAVVVTLPAGVATTISRLTTTWLSSSVSIVGTNANFTVATRVFVGGGGLIVDLGTTGSSLFTSAKTEGSSGFISVIAPRAEFGSGGIMGSSFVVKLRVADARVRSAVSIYSLELRNTYIKLDPNFDLTVMPYEILCGPNEALTGSTVELSGTGQLTTFKVMAFTYCLLKQETGTITMSENSGRDITNTGTGVLTIAAGTHANDGVLRAPNGGSFRQAVPGLFLAGGWAVDGCMLNLTSSTPTTVYTATRLWLQNNATVYMHPQLSNCPVVSKTGFNTIHLLKPAVTNTMSLSVEGTSQLIVNVVATISSVATVVSSTGRLTVNCPNCKTSPVWCGSQNSTDFEDVANWNFYDAGCGRVFGLSQTANWDATIVKSAFALPSGQTPCLPAAGVHLLTPAEILRASCSYSPFPYVQAGLSDGSVAGVVWNTLDTTDYFDCGQCTAAIGSLPNHLQHWDWIDFDLNADGTGVPTVTGVKMASFKDGAHWIESFEMYGRATDFACCTNSAACDSTSSFTLIQGFSPAGNSNLQTFMFTTPVSNFRYYRFVVRYTEGWQPWVTEFQFIYGPGLCATGVGSADITIYNSVTVNSLVAPNSAPIIVESRKTLTVTTTTTVGSGANVFVRFPFGSSNGAGINQLGATVSNGVLAYELRSGALAIFKLGTVFGAGSLEIRTTSTTSPVTVDLSTIITGLLQVAQFRATGPLTGPVPTSAVGVFKVPLAVGANTQSYTVTNATLVYSAASPSVARTFTAVILSNGYFVDGSASPPSVVATIATLTVSQSEYNILGSAGNFSITAASVGGPLYVDSRSVKITTSLTSLSTGNVILEHTALALGVSLATGTYLGSFDLRASQIKLPIHASFGIGGQLTASSSDAAYSSVDVSGSGAITVLGEVRSPDGKLALGQDGNTIMRLGKQMGSAAHTITIRTRNANTGTLKVITTAGSETASLVFAGTAILNATFEWVVPSGPIPTGSVSVLRSLVTFSGNSAVGLDALYVQGGSTFRASTNGLSVGSTTLQSDGPNNAITVYDPASIIVGSTLVNDGTGVLTLTSGSGPVLTGPITGSGLVIVNCPGCQINAVWCATVPGSFADSANWNFNGAGCGRLSFPQTGAWDVTLNSPTAYATINEPTFTIKTLSVGSSSFLNVTGALTVTGLCTGLTGCSATIAAATSLSCASTSSLGSMTFSPTSSGVVFTLGATVSGVGDVRFTNPPGSSPTTSATVTFFGAVTGVDLILTGQSWTQQWTFTMPTVFAAPLLSVTNVALRFVSNHLTPAELRLKSALVRGGNNLNVAVTTLTSGAVGDYSNSTIQLTGAATTVSTTNIALQSSVVLIAPSSVAVAASGSVAIAAAATLSLDTPVATIGSPFAVAGSIQLYATAVTGATNVDFDAGGALRCLTRTSGGSSCQVTVTGTGIIAGRTALTTTTLPFTLRQSGGGAMTFGVIKGGALIRTEFAAAASNLIVASLSSTGDFGIRGLSVFVPRPVITFVSASTTFAGRLIVESADLYFSGSNLVAGGLSLLNDTDLIAAAGSSVDASAGSCISTGSSGIFITGGTASIACGSIQVTSGLLSLSIPDSNALTTGPVSGGGVLSACTAMLCSAAAVWCGGSGGGSPLSLSDVAAWNVESRGCGRYFNLPFSRLDASIGTVTNDVATHDVASATFVLNSLKLGTNAVVKVGTTASATRLQVSGDITCGSTSDTPQIVLANGGALKSNSITVLCSLVVSAQTGGESVESQSLVVPGGWIPRFVFGATAGSSATATVLVTGVLPLSALRFEGPLPTVRTQKWVLTVPGGDSVSTLAVYNTEVVTNTNHIGILTVNDAVCTFAPGQSEASIGSIVSTSTVGVTSTVRADTSVGELSIGSVSINQAVSLSAFSLEIFGSISTAVGGSGKLSLAAVTATIDSGIANLLSDGLYLSNTQLVVGADAPFEIAGSLNCQFGTCSVAVSASTAIKVNGGTKAGSAVVVYKQSTGLLSTGVISGNAVSIVNTGLSIITPLSVNTGGAPIGVPLLSLSSTTVGAPILWAVPPTLSFDLFIDSAPVTFTGNSLNGLRAVNLTQTGAALIGSAGLSIGFGRFTSHAGNTIVSVQTTGRISFNSTSVLDGTSTWTASSAFVTPGPVTGAGQLIINCPNCNVVANWCGPSSGDFNSADNWNVNGLGCGKSGVWPVRQWKAVIPSCVSIDVTASVEVNSLSLGGSCVLATLSSAGAVLVNVTSRFTCFSAQSTLTVRVNSGSTFAAASSNSTCALTYESGSGASGEGFKFDDLSSTAPLSFVKTSAGSGTSASVTVRTLTRLSTLLFSAAPFSTHTWNWAAATQPVAFPSRVNLTNVQLQFSGEIWPQTGTLVVLIDSKLYSNSRSASISALAVYGNSEIYVSGGSYIVTGPITIASGSSLILESFDSVVLTGVVTGGPLYKWCPTCGGTMKFCVPTGGALTAANWARINLPVPASCGLHVYFPSTYDYVLNASGAAGAPTFTLPAGVTTYNSFTIFSPAATTTLSASTGSLVVSGAFRVLNGANLNINFGAGSAGTLSAGSIYLTNSTHFSVRAILVTGTGGLMADPLALCLDCGRLYFDNCANVTSYGPVTLRGGAVFSSPVDTVFTLARNMPFVHGIDADINSLLTSITATASSNAVRINLSGTSGQFTSYQQINTGRPFYIQQAVATTVRLCQYFGDIVFTGSGSGFITIVRQTSSSSEPTKQYGITTFVAPSTATTFIWTPPSGVVGAWSAVVVDGAALSYVSAPLATDTQFYSITIKNSGTITGGLGLPLGHGALTVVSEDGASSGIYLNGNADYRAGQTVVVTGTLTIRTFTILYPGTITTPAGTLVQQCLGCGFGTIGWCVGDGNWTSPANWQRPPGACGTSVFALYPTLDYWIDTGSALTITLPAATTTTIASLTLKRNVQFNAPSNGGLTVTGPVYADTADVTFNFGNGALAIGGSVTASVQIAVYALTGSIAGSFISPVVDSGKLYLVVPGGFSITGSADLNGGLALTTTPLTLGVNANLDVGVSSNAATELLVVNTGAADAGSSITLQGTGLYTSNYKTMAFRPLTIRQPAGAMNFAMLSGNVTLIGNGALTITSSQLACTLILKGTLGTTYTMTALPASILSAAVYIDSVTYNWVGGAVGSAFTEVQLFNGGLFSVAANQNFGHAGLLCTSRGGPGNNAISVSGTGLVQCAATVVSGTSTLQFNVGSSSYNPGVIRLDPAARLIVNCPNCVTTPRWCQPTAPGAYLNITDVGQYSFFGAPCGRVLGLTNTANWNAIVNMTGIFPVQQNQAPRVLRFSASYGPDTYAMVASRMGDGSTNAIAWNAAGAGTGSCAVANGGPPNPRLDWMDFDLGSSIPTVTALLFGGFYDSAHGTTEIKLYGRTTEDTCCSVGTTLCNSVGSWSPVLATLVPQTTQMGELQFLAVATPISGYRYIRVMFSATQGGWQSYITELQFVYGITIPFSTTFRNLRLYGSPVIHVAAGKTLTTSTSIDVMTNAQARIVLGSGSTLSHGDSTFTGTLSVHSLSTSSYSFTYVTGTGNQVLVSHAGTFSVVGSTQFVANALTFLGPGAISYTKPTTFTVAYINIFNCAVTLQTSSATFAATTTMTFRYTTPSITGVANQQIGSATQACLVDTQPGAAAVTVSGTGTARCVSTNVMAGATLTFTAASSANIFLGTVTGTTSSTATTKTVTG